MTSFTVVKRVIDSSETIEFTIANHDKSVQFVCISYGATIMKIITPDKNGNSENIVLCYETIEDLKSKRGPYYGTVPGRYANRIGGGKFTLDGDDHLLAINNGPNSLHGGLLGFDQKNWTAVEFNEASRAGVKFSYVSPDGEEGYPGELHVDVTYSLTDLNELEIDYYAETIGRATVLNLTNHTYFNLSGNCRRKILDHKLHLSCSHYLPATDELLPTGEIRSVVDTLFDFLSSTSNGKRLGDVVPLIDGGGQPGLDHCFTVDGYTETQRADGILRHVATATDEESGRQLICRATLPGVQVYTGNWLSPDTQEVSVHPHVQHNAICLETQHYPDSPNQPLFPSTILRPGQQYKHKAVFAFRTVA